MTGIGASPDGSGPGRERAGGDRNRTRTAGPRVATAGLALTTVLLAAACVGAGSGNGDETGGIGAGAVPAQEPVVGCYRFLETAGSEALGLPWGVILDEGPLEEGWPLVERFEEVRRARTATSETGRADVPFGYWRPVAGDSVEIGHPGGGGVVLVVAPADGGLAGTGRSAGDALQPGQEPGPRPSRPVRARRFECPG